MTLVLEDASRVIFRHAVKRAREQAREADRHTLDLVHHLPDAIAEWRPARRMAENSVAALRYAAEQLLAEADRLETAIRDLKPLEET